MADSKGLKLLKNEINLADAAEDPQKRHKMLTFGVIIDISEPFRFEDKDDYVTKIKIIDPTFNFKAYITNKEIKFHKFVTIQIYSKVLDKGPKVKKVGEILRLRRFEFCLSQKGELIAFQNIFSNWMIFKGEKKASYAPTSYFDIEKNHNREITKFEKSRIDELREWSHNFFSQNKLKFITWWTPLIDVADETEASKSKHITDEVDIILKTEAVSKEKCSVEFFDHAKKRYSLFLNLPPLISKGDVIKLRCVNIIYTVEGRVIQLTAKSSCLIVPPHFYDAVSFTKSDGEQSPTRPAGKTELLKKEEEEDERAAKKSRTQSPKKKSRSTSPATAMQIKKFPFLSEFDLSNWDHSSKHKARRAGTLISSKYSRVKPTPIDQLLALLNDPTSHEHQRFVIKGYILNFNNTRVSEIVKKVSNQKVLDFGTKSNDENLNYIYHFIANVKDDSVDSDQRSLNVYILTNEEDQHLFDVWEILPRPNEVQKWKSLSKNTMENFHEKLISLTEPEVEIKMVVELLITASGKAFFKLYDTIFV